MEYFSIVKETDLFEGVVEEPVEYKLRPTAKGIVLDEHGRVALLSNGEHSLFPGGGVEKGETYEEAFIRECIEEIGCKVGNIQELGSALQYSASIAMEYQVTFFIATVSGEKGTPTTKEVGELACVLSWVAPEEVTRILEDQIPFIRKDDYRAHFNCRTHLAAWNLYLKKGRV